MDALEDTNAHLLAQAQMTRVAQESNDKFTAVGIAFGPNPLTSSVRRLHELRFAVGPIFQAQMLLAPGARTPPPEDIADLVNAGVRGLDLILGSLVVASTQSSVEVGNAYFDSLYREAATGSDLALGMNLTEPQLAFVTRAVDSVKGRKRPFDTGGGRGWNADRLVPRLFYFYCIVTMSVTICTISPCIHLSTPWIMY
jgi:hypothetical protein